LTALKELFESAEGRKEQTIGKRYQTLVDSPAMTFASRITALTKFAKDNSTSPYAALAQKRLAEMERQKPAPTVVPK
jgi:predicted negative regulator of RcsB-dependent stress response